MQASHHKHLTGRLTKATDVFANGTGKHIHTQIYGEHQRQKHSLPGSNSWMGVLLCRECL